MRAIFCALCSAAILVNIFKQANCATEINCTSTRNVTTGSSNVSEAGPPIHVILANRAKRTRREAIDYAQDIYEISAQRRGRRGVTNDGIDSETPKRSVTFNGGTHEHNYHRQGTGACQSYKFLRPNEAKGHVFRAGYDVYGHELGICRAVVGKDLTPGKYREDVGACLVPWGSKEHRLTSRFKVLTMPEPKYFSWERLSNGQVPAHAMAWGRASDGKPKYIARCLARWRGRTTLVPGKIHNGRMTFAFDWKEYLCGQQSTEVLTCKGA